MPSMCKRINTMRKILITIQDEKGEDLLTRTYFEDARTAEESFDEKIEDMFDTLDNPIEL